MYICEICVINTTCIIVKWKKVNVCFLSKSKKKRKYFIKWCAFDAITSRGCWDVSLLALHIYALNLCPISLCIKPQAHSDLINDFCEYQFLSVATVSYFN